MKWTCRTHRKVTVELSKRWDGPSAFLLHRRNCQAFYRTQKKILANFASARQTRSSNVLLHLKFCQILQPYSFNMDASTLQKTVGCLSRQ